MAESGIELLKGLLKAHDAAYSDAVLTFTGLDSKAQNTTSLAGIFLGAVFAFFNGNYLLKAVSFGGSRLTYLLAAIVVSLILAIIFCISAMWTRNVRIYDLAISKSEIEDILSLQVDPDEDKLDLIQQNYLIGQIEEASSVIYELRTINLKKGLAVKRGQVALLVAVCLAGLTILLILFNVNGHVVTPN